MDSKGPNLEQIYSEICDGFSEIGDLKINHLSFVEESRLKKHYNIALDRYISLGARPESDILLENIKKGTWSQAKEMHLKSIRDKIEGLERSKSKIKSFDQIDAIYDSIEGLRKELKEVSLERYSILTESAENKAEARLRFYTIAASVLKNDNGWAGITEDYLDSLSDREYVQIENSFLEKTYLLNYENIKKVCIQSFFYSVFNLSEKSFDFFLKPLINLTIPQVTMLRVGETFAKVANEVPDLPKEYEGNPDKILMFWYAVKNGAHEIEKKKEEQGSSIRNLFTQLRQSGM